MEVDDPDNPERNAASALDPKSKGKRKLYVGSQALGYRRDHMEVSLFSMLWRFGTSLIDVCFVISIRHCAFSSGTAKHKGWSCC